LVRHGGIRSLVEASVAEYERALDQAAAKVIARLQARNPVRLLWVTGPSSSGKTTTTVKLTARLKKEGLRFVTLNVDDYFWPLIDHPTDWINDRNFETPEALDIQLLNEHLRKLLEGEAVDQPVYSFKEGRRVATRPLQLAQDQILLLDCLHGLYPPIVEGIDPSTQFRLYLDTYNGLFEGDGTTRRLTRFTDVRLIRRMLRDARHRNHPPMRTLLHWHYVRSGELFSIIPLSGLADAVVNGGFPFELSALLPWLTGPDGLLPRPEDLAGYGDFLDARIRFEHVQRLAGTVAGLSRETMSGYDLIPGDSLIREFIGGGTLRIPHND